jgi:hypothetical protein
MTWVAWFTSATEHARRAWARVEAWATRTPPWKVALAFAAAGLALALLFPMIGALLVLALIGGVAWGWLSEFAILMRTPPSAFPGRHDRWLWSVVMIVFAPVAWLAFRMYRQGESRGASAWTSGGAPKPSARWDDEGYF